jgi:drug/metabolite transporter (DMT)-like permease
MTVGAVILLALMPLFHESYALPRTGSTLTTQVYLVLIGTVGVFALYLYVLSTWTASAVSYEFVLAPLVAIVLAAWLLDEPGAIRPARAAGTAIRGPRAEAGEPPRAG